MAEKGATAFMRSKVLNNALLMMPAISTPVIRNPVTGISKVIIKFLKNIPQSTLSHSGLKCAGIAMNCKWRAL
jgi:hypothetical protein